MLDRQTTTGVELCAGTLCVGLSGLAGHLVAPITGFMGSKRRWRSPLARAAFGFGEIDRLIAVDSGPWGDVWQTLGPLGLRADVERLLRLEAKKGLLSERWPVLVEREPSEDPAERVAQYLMLQARSASCIPIWWDGKQWVGPTGRRTEKAHRSAQALLGQQAGRPANPRDRRSPLILGPACEQHPGRRERAQCQIDGAVECHASSRRIGHANPRKIRGSGLLNIDTLADRVAALQLVPLDRLEVYCCSVEDIDPILGSRVLFDPPYSGSPRYADVLPRTKVLDVARRHAQFAERVVVCEGEPLPLEGWSSWSIDGRREWVTTWNVEPAPLPLQLSLDQQLRAADA